MEINPYESRLRMLQQIDTVAMQREAAPDEETAGCPGCPYFWTCPVPHRGEEVRAPQEPGEAEVQEALPGRRSFVPRDESDVGWTDVWLDEDGLRIDPEELEERRRAEQERRATSGPSVEERDPAEEPDPAEAMGQGAEGPADEDAPVAPERRRRWWRRSRG